MPPPSDAPRVEQIGIKVNGADLPHGVMDLLAEVEVETTLHLPSMFTMRFHDDELTLLQDSSKFQLAQSVEIAMTPPLGSGSPVTIMKGEITAIEPDFEEGDLAILTIRGYDKIHRLNRESKTKAFVNVKDSDVVGQIATDNRLSATKQETSQVHKLIVQDGQTDFAMLTMLAQRNGFETFVDNTTLYFRKPRGARGQITLNWGENLRIFRPRLSIANQVNEVVVRGWDPVQKQTIEATASTSSASPETGLGQWGGQAAQSAMSSATRVEVGRPVDSATDATDLAQALLDEINAGFIEAEGIAFGTPTLIAGAKVQIQKVGTRFSGTYMITSARHVYSGGQYDTFFTVEGSRPQSIADLLGATAAAESGARWGGVYPAIVTDTMDPEKLCRVKLKFPWLDNDNVVSEWAPVMGIGAGPTRGFQWLPEIDDEVLVAFEYGDFNRPYVLGGLWNNTDQPPETNAVNQGKVDIRTLKTRDGHIVRFTDGQNKAIEIIDAENQTSVKMDTVAKKITVTSQGDLELTAQGNIKIQAQGNVEITASGDSTVKGMNVNAEAQTALSLKGNASGSLESSGMVKVKGSMVNIN